MTVLEIVAEVAARLDRLGIAYAVGGSLASSTWGQMRQTNDADFVLRLVATNPDDLIAAFPPPYQISRGEIAQAMGSTEDFRPVQLLHMDEAFKIDLFVVDDAPYPKSELERARLIEIASGAFVRFCAPENVVIAKLRWYELGNRVSDRQWNDIVQVLEVQRGQLDDPYLDHWSVHFGVAALLTEARAQAIG